MRRRLSVLAVAAVVVSGCEPLAPDESQWREDPRPAAPAFSAGRADAELTFGRYADGVSPPVTPVSFVVEQGVASTQVVPYAGLAGDPVLLEFEVGAESLLAYLDGSPVLPGDRVPITVTFDPQRFIFHFEPSGLTFSPKDPARLRVNYEGADADVNGDTVVDERDAALKQQFRLWQQEQSGLWRSLPTTRLPGDIIEGRVTHFTGFAMAS